MSEVWHMRGGTVSNGDAHGSNTQLRWVANIVFTIGAFRMMMKYCPDHPIHIAINAPQDWLKNLSKEEAKKAPVVREMTSTVVSSPAGGASPGGRAPRKGSNVEIDF